MTDQGAAEPSLETDIYDRVHLGYTDTIIVHAAPSIFTIRFSAYRRPTPEEYAPPKVATAEMDGSDVSLLLLYGQDLSSVFWTDYRWSLMQMWDGWRWSAHGMPSRRLREYPIAR